MEQPTQSKLALFVEMSAGNKIRRFDSFSPGSLRDACLEEKVTKQSRAFDNH